MLVKEGNILIVDDNKELLLALKLYLQPHFAKIITEHNPNRLKEHLRNNAFDIVMLDMNFTAGINTGNEGLYWMREVHAFDPEQAVVFITGTAMWSWPLKPLKRVLPTLSRSRGTNVKYYPHFCLFTNYKNRNVTLTALKKSNST